MIGNRLQMLRKGKKLSRAALGEALGVSATAVYKWEKGLAEPSLSTLQQLAGIYGLTVGELLGEEQPELDTIAVMSRAVRLMTPEEREQYLAVGRALFKRAFGEAEK